MILILTASIMYWSLQQQAGDAENTPDGSSPADSVSSETETVLSNDVSNMTISDAASNASLSPQAADDEPSSEKIKNDEASETIDGQNKEWTVEFHFFFFGLIF